MGPLIRIYCDGNAGIDEKRVDLSCPGSMAEIAKCSKDLKEGQRVLFNEPDDWEADGTSHFDQEANRWFGVPDFFTLGTSIAKPVTIKRPNQTRQAEMTALLQQ